jgi:hypothetical protein
MKEVCVSGAAPLGVAEYQEGVRHVMLRDENGMVRGYPPEVYMLYGAGNETEELTGQDPRDAGSFESKYRSAMLNLPVEDIALLQTNTEYLHWQAKEGGDIAWYLFAALEAHDMSTSDAVAAITREVAPKCSIQAETFTDFDAIVHAYRNALRIKIADEDGTLRLADPWNNSLEVVNAVYAAYETSADAMLRNHNSQENRDALSLATGRMLWCISWIAQFRFKTTFNDMAVQNLEKVRRRALGGAALVFGRGDRR